MQKLQTFQDFLATQNVQVSIWGFMINLILAALLAYILSKVYTKYGTSLSNRKMFAQNFILLATTTMLIISIVKSSLALSLGLVGALSIVRFRAAIKEPEELAYLFLTIALGLGFGAGQTVITIAAFIFIIGIIWMKSVSHRKEENQNLHLTIYSHSPEKLELDSIVEILNRHCSSVNLKRFDETKETSEIYFMVEFNSLDNLKNSKAELQKLSDSVKITFLDNKGILSY
jgi:uncharacterized membrane protein YhiD involved in acid resistance